MAKKNKLNQQPNAPELNQILLQSTSLPQPPHNPYYPDQSPPPPYPNLSQHVHQIPDHGYSRMTAQNVSPTVIVHRQPLSYYDHRAAKNHKRVRGLNCSILLSAITAICLAFYATSLYQQRTCLNYIVHQPTDDISIRISDVRDMHMHVMWASVLLVVLCLAKAASGESKSYSCYLLLMFIFTFALTTFTGYLAYLSFYSPCTTKPGEVLSNGLRTIAAQIAGKLPSPDRGQFGESNVLQLAQDDKQGVIILICDLIVWFFYFSGFLNLLIVCSKN